MSARHPRLRSAPSRLVGQDAAWAGVVVWSVLVSLLRVNPTYDLLHPYVWLGLQAAPVALMAAWLTKSTGPPITAASRRLLFVAAALVAWCAVTVAWSPDPLRTAGQTVTLVAFTGFVLATALRRWPARLASDLRTLWLVGLVVAAAGLASRLAGVPSSVGVAGRLQGVMGNPNYLGILLVTTIFAGAWLLSRSAPSGWRTWAGRAGLGACAGMLLATGSRGAMLALAVGVAVALVSAAGRRLVTIGLVLAGGAGAAMTVALWFVAPPVVIPAEVGIGTASADLDNVFGDKDGASDKGGGSGGVADILDRDAVDTDFTSGRRDIWQMTLDEAATRPVHGHGYRTSEVVLDGINTHALPLSLVLELGLVGVVLFALLLWQLLRCAWSPGPADGILLGAVAAISVQELLESTLHAPTGPTALLQWLLLLAVARSRPDSVDHGDDAPGSPERDSHDHPVAAHRS